jgi:hypothetical protein
VRQRLAQGRDDEIDEREQLQRQAIPRVMDEVHTAIDLFFAASSAARAQPVASDSSTTTYRFVAVT